MTKPKISVSQLVILLALSRLFCTINGILHHTGDGFGVAYLWAIPISALLQFILVLPALYLSEKEGESLITVGYAVWGKGGAVLAMACGIYFLFSAIATVFSLEQFMVNAIYPESSPLFFILTLAAAGAYAAHLGIESISRSAFIVFLIFSGGVLFALLGTWDQINVILIRPLTQSGFGEILRISLQLVARSPEILLFCLLLPNLNTAGKRKRTVFYYLLISSVFLEVITFLVSSVLGGLAESEAFPFHTVGTLAKVSIFQRLDAVYMGIWVFVSFIRAGIYLWAATEMFQCAVPVKKHQFVLPFLAIIVFIGSLFVGMNKRGEDVLYPILFSGIPIFVLFPMVSFLLILSQKMKKPIEQEDAKLEE